jgi:hypothetical protein
LPLAAFRSDVGRYAVSRRLLILAAVAACPLVAGAEQTITSTEMVIKMTVRPKAAPQPALRYQLLPELKEMNPGNPIPNYTKCLMDRDLSQKETLGRAALRQADRAARLDKPDWQIIDRLRLDGIGTLIPDIQGVRELAAGLQERSKAEVAADQVDDALVTAKTMFAMSRHLSEHPTLIGGLVGVAIATMSINQLQDLIELPGCPNLYWALTSLPSPLVPIAKGLEGERVGIASQFKLMGLDEVNPMSEEQIAKVGKSLDRTDPDVKPDPKSSTKAKVTARAKDPAAVSAARKRLVEYGIPEERLARFPAGQVILLDEKREFDVRRDELMKLMPLPYWQIDELTRGAVTREKALFDTLLPALLKVRQAESRADQRIALLRHVEALRMYAAGHDGKLPDKLEDVGVPLPVDPFSGKAFGYERKGDTAVLRGSPPRGGEKNPAYNVRFEVTVEK